MKIGILTFHSQLNYGGVLQCWALKEVLKSLGHDVVVIDRWLDSTNQLLNGPFGSTNWKGWVGIWLHRLMGCGGYYSKVVRYARTRKFVRELGLTSYHFYDWNEAPKDLGVDCLVVGSDQIWHGGDWGYPDPRPYLLEGAGRINAIAYAGSFGMKELLPQYDFAAGFRRFLAISVRESEGRKLVESTGAAATHVVDPTLLLSREGWQKMGRFHKKSKTVVCYCLVERLEEQKSVLEVWARKTGRRVTIISEDGEPRSFPKRPEQVLRRLKDMLLEVINPPRVRIECKFGPKEFYRAFAEADECITNSFHAVMFSYICRCNVRFLRPVTQARMGMFARIEEFVKTAVNGSFVVDNLTSALDSLDSDSPVTFKEDEIDSKREFSRQWLVNALQSIPTSSIHA